MSVLRSSYLVAGSRQHRLLHPLPRADRRAGDAHFPVQVRAGGEAGRADEADHVAGVDRLTDADQDLRLVEVAGQHAEAVINRHEIAANIEMAGVDNAPSRGRMNRCALWRADVQPA